MSTAQITSSHVLRCFSGNAVVDYALALALAISPMGTSAATLFKCQNANGGIEFQDRKCEQASEVSSRELKVAPVAKAAPPQKESEAVFVLINVDSHNTYRVAGFVNDIPVQMVVDTGASLVAIPSALAAMAGVGCNSTIRVSTANGATTICKSTVKSLRIGSIALQDIEVMLLPNAHEVLLGQSALGRLKVEQSKGVLRLSTQ